jgi:hypothetical protein
MSSPRRSTSDAHNPLLFAVCGAVLIVFIGIGLYLYERRAADAQAQALADQLIAAFAAQGYPTPNRDTVVGLLGTDGGAVCADPGSALKQALRNDAISNGAGGPGQRPVIGAGSVVRAELLILEVYCPEQLPSVRELIDDLELTDHGEAA